MSELVDFFVQPGTVVCAGIAFVAWLYTEHVMKPQPAEYPPFRQEDYEAPDMRGNIDQWPQKRAAPVVPEQKLYLNSLHTTAIPECINPHGRGGSNRIAFAVRGEDSR